MEVVFRSRIKIRDIYARYENIDEIARTLSRVIVDWDVIDIYTEEPLPLPEFDTCEWRQEVDDEIFEAVVSRWVDYVKSYLEAQWGKVETADGELPKANAEPSSST